MPTLLALLIAVLGGGGLATVVIKILSRPVDGATVLKLKAEAKQTAQETAASEVGLLREIIAEVRTSESDKVARITRLEEVNDQFRTRLDKLEERERHMLTRAAVHEAWDVMAFNFITGHNQNFPPPPPLSPPAIDQPRPAED